MQSQSMLDEVDAIKKQLKLLGHNVPTDVIITFLENNNQLVPSHTPAEVPRAPLQPFAVHRDVQRSYRTTQTGYLRQAVPQQPVSAQTGARPPPQLDTAWAGVNAAVSSTGAYEQVHKLELYSTTPSDTAVTTAVTGYATLVA